MTQMTAREAVDVLNDARAKGYITEWHLTPSTRGEMTGLTYTVSFLPKKRLKDMRISRQIDYANQGRTPSSPRPEPPIIEAAISVLRRFPELKS